MESVSTNLIAIVLLLAANGFFVAAEFALVKARGFRIESRAAEGSAAAQLTLRIQENLESYLAACQLGITMASLGLGWVGEPFVAALLEPLFTEMGLPQELLHTAAFLSGFLIFSALHIVIGEQVPKTLAIRKPEPVSLWVAYPLHGAYLMAYPLNWLLNRATNAILSFFKVEQASHGDVLSSEELKGLVFTSKAHGEIEHDKAVMLRNMFEFDQRQVGRVMIPRGNIDILDVSASPDENLAVIRDSGHSRFPLLDSAADDDIVGLVLAKDLYTAMLQGQPQPWIYLREYCRKPLVVPESQRVATLFETMRSHRAHMAMVVNEYGELVGIVTLEDLLEEIVGEIEDETDDAVPPAVVTAIGENRWQADGLASLSDIERTIGLKVPDEIDAHTLSGLFMERLGCMPETGHNIVEAGFKLSVESIEDRRVGLILIEKLLLDEAEEQDQSSD